MEEHWQGQCVWHPGTECPPLKQDDIFGKGWFKSVNVLTSVKGELHIMFARALEGWSSNFYWKTTCSEGWVYPCSDITAWTMLPPGLEQGRRGDDNG
jgi:hypothetical protein